MIEWWQEMHPYAVKQDIINGMTDFIFADEEVDPECLRGNYWELIKEDLVIVLEETRQIFDLYHNCLQLIPPNHKSFSLIRVVV